MTGTPVWSIRLPATRAAAAKTVGRCHEKMSDSGRTAIWSFSWTAHGDMSTRGRFWKSRRRIAAYMPAGFTYFRNCAASFSRGHSEAKGTKGLQSIRTSGLPTTMRCPVGAALQLAPAVPWQPHLRIDHRLRFLWWTRAPFARVTEWLITAIRANRTEKMLGPSTSKPVPISTGLKRRFPSRSSVPRASPSDHLFRPHARSRGTKSGPRSGYARVQIQLHW